MTTEEWRPVVGWEGLYEVSSEGRVRSLDRDTPNARTGGTSRIKGRVLVGRINRGGYRQFTFCVKQQNTTVRAHQMVARAFIPNPDNYPLVLHGPGGKLDNSVGNLRWGTQSDNMLDKRRDGTDHKLNKTHCPQGHEYTVENTRMDAGARKCRECIRVRSRERYWNLRNSELERRRSLGLPEEMKVPKCNGCGRFISNKGKHECKGDA